jgi:excisionase family DNA binding protein
MNRQPGDVDLASSFRLQRPKVQLRVTRTDRRYPVTPVPAPEHTWLTLGELAELLHITERHVRRLVAEQRIPYSKVGGRLRFNLARIQGWLDQNSHGPDQTLWRGRPA